MDRTVNAPPRAQHLALAGMVVACAGCVVDHDVTVELDFSGQDRSDVATYVLGVYEGDICHALEIDGFPPLFSFTSESHATDRRHFQVFEPGGEEPVGELDEGMYSFVGLALDETCIPLFAGCRRQRVEESGGVVIDMEDLGASAIMPFCGNLLIGCVDGRCTDLL